MYFLRPTGFTKNCWHGLIEALHTLNFGGIAAQAG
jgi:hypothetical protein